MESGEYLLYLIDNHIDNVVFDAENAYLIDFGIIRQHYTTIIFYGLIMIANELGIEIPITM